MFNISDSDEDNSSSDDGGQSTSSTASSAKAKCTKLNKHRQKANLKHSDEDDDDDDSDKSNESCDKENKVMRCDRRQEQVPPPPTRGGSIANKLVLNKHLSNKNLPPPSKLPHPDKTNHLPQFSRSSVGGSKYLLTCHPNPQPDIEDLVFESRFESGNLAKAVKITSGYYELYLRPDMYTNRHTQWFYFRVSNTRKNVNYRWGDTCMLLHRNEERIDSHVLLPPFQALHCQPRQIRQPVQRGYAAADVFRHRGQSVPCGLAAVRRQHHLLPQR